MPSQPKTPASRQLTLTATTAADLMTSNPLSIRQDASVKEAAAFLIDKGISAAPVIDDAGRAVGVLSRTDIVIHHRQQSEFLSTGIDYYERSDLQARGSDTVPAGFQVEEVDMSRVMDIMTPVVFSVSQNEPAQAVIATMVDSKVHRLFVVDGSNVLIGVISALDVLRRLQ